MAALDARQSKKGELPTRKLDPPKNRRVNFMPVLTSIHNGTMTMETSLQKIELLSRQREYENWRFRCYLKSSDLSAAKIDAVVQWLYREVAKQIDCTSCGNCCRVKLPLLTTADIKRLATHLGMTVRQFRADYVTTDHEEENASVFNVKPCPFLQENRCSVYDCRPRDCRSYPHLHKKDFVFRMNQAYDNCSVCPIVFNVNEGLKGELWSSKKAG